MATDWPVVNLPCQNSVYTTGGSRKMFFYKLPTNPGKHFEGQNVENSLNFKMQYSNMIGISTIMVSVSHMKCYISKHARQQQGRAS
jgi:hypothetical protein